MTESRPLIAQLATARLLIAQFEQQILEHDTMNRAKRRTPRGRDLTNRIEKLREGLTIWRKRATDLETQLNTDNPTNEETALAESDRKPADSGEAGL